MAAGRRRAAHSLPSSLSPGFVEFRTIAEATSCIALNNIELGGKQLRVERPRDYAPMPEALLDELRKANILGNTSVAPDGQDHLSAPQPNPLAAVPLPHTAAALAAAGGCGSTSAAANGVPIEAARAAVGASAGGTAAMDLSTASAVVVLANMVTAEESANDAEMLEILEDTKSECEKHGTVRAQRVHERISQWDAVISPRELRAHRLQPTTLSHQLIYCAMHRRSWRLLQVVSMASPKPGTVGDGVAGLGVAAIAQKIFVRFKTQATAIACATVCCPCGGCARVWSCPACVSRHPPSPFDAACFIPHVCALGGGPHRLSSRSCTASSLMAAPSLPLSFRKLL